MKYIDKKTDSGNRVYKITESGTAYKEETCEAIVEVLERCRQQRIRIRVYYGGPDGRDWQDEFGTTGYVGRSTGNIKIPLVVYNSRSLGGGAMLDHCIVKIVTTKGKEILYQHPNYHI